MKSTAKQKTQAKLKAEHDARHKERTKRGRRTNKVAKRILNNEPTSADLEKGRPEDTGRFGA